MSLLILNALDISRAKLEIFSFALAAAGWVVVALIAARCGWQLDQRPVGNDREL